VEIVITEPLSTVLKDLARSAGKDIDTYLAELLSGKVDPEERIKIYLALYAKFIREAEELERKKDFVQASEKYWGLLLHYSMWLAKRKIGHTTHIGTTGK